MTYEKPTLSIVGNAADVVLGVYGQGFDLDGTIVSGDAEFEPDAFAPTVDDRS